MSLAPAEEPREDVMRVVPAALLLRLVLFQPFLAVSVVDCPSLGEMSFVSGEES